MRRYEFVEGSSAKFWQVEVTGSSFQVTFGRLGTAGQTQVKSFADAAEAQAEADKLIREKKGKGYREVGAAVLASVKTPPPAIPPAVTWTRANPATPVASAVPAQAPAPPSPLENVFAAALAHSAALIAAKAAVLAAALAVGTAPVSGPAPGTLWNVLRGARLQLGFGAADPFRPEQIGLSEAAMPRLERLHLGEVDLPLLARLGLPAADELLQSPEPPLARSPAADSGYYALFPYAELAEFQVLRGGLPYALGTLIAASEDPAFPWDERDPQGSASKFRHWLALRRLAATAAPADYAAARALAERVRAVADRPLAAYIATVFPNEGWADGDLAKGLAAYARVDYLADALGVLLVDASFGQAQAFIQGGRYLAVGPWRGCGLAQGLLARHGPAATSLFAQLFDRRIDDPMLRREVIDAWVAVRTEDSYQLLIERSHHRDLGLAVRTAFLSHPRLGIEVAALQVVREDREETPKQILRAVAAAHPALAAEVAAGLPPAAAAALRARLPGGAAAVYAAPDAWPEALGRDPLEKLPGRIPRLPAFWDASLWTAPRLLGGEALPPAAVDRLGTMLAHSRQDLVHAGLLQVREACEPASLEAFAWDLFQSWLAFGARPKEQWAMLALSRMGGDASARRLIPLIRRWRAEGWPARAALGLEVLAKMGSDVALVLLQSFVDKAELKSLRAIAREKLTRVAAERGLTFDELVDGLIPDLGLAADGSVELDFGRRRFRVAFDERLQPYVLDEQGKKLADLPRPKASDDLRLAAAATGLFRTLKQDASSLAGMQILRLEKAMAAGRRFGREAFESGFVRHPLIRHLTRRLVWAAHAGSEIFYFRVAEDGTYADREDAAWQLPDSCEVSVAHPLGMPAGELAALTQVFADYELLQPFAQLRREIFILTAEEQAQDELDRFAGRELPTVKLMGLEKRGWRRGERLDGDARTWFERRLENKTLYLNFRDGIDVADFNLTPVQTLKTVMLSRQAGHAQKELAFGLLSPLEASEMLRDLHLLFR